MMSAVPIKPPQQLEETEDRTVVTVSIDDHRQLAYTEYGNPDGVPLVVLHGTPGSRRLARLFDGPAERRGVRVLALDRPGYGRSSPWPTRSVRDAGSFVTTMLDDVGVQTAGIAAFSGGSADALATAVTHPERVGRVDVIAGATPPDLSTETPVVQRVLSAMAARTPGVLRGMFRGQAWLAKHLDPSFVVAQYTSDGNQASLPDAVAAVIKEDFIEAFACSRAGAVTEFRNTSTDWDLSFDEIDADVCLWHGENDTNVPLTGVRKLETRIPTARLEVVANADHLRTLLQSIPHVLDAQHQETNSNLG